MSYPSKQAQDELKDELFYQQAVQSILWAAPLLNMYVICAIARERHDAWIA